jgi:uncharacterized membrane protein
MKNCTTKGVECATERASDIAASDNAANALVAGFLIFVPAIIAAFTVQKVIHWLSWKNIFISDEIEDSAMCFTLVCFSIIDLILYLAFWG